MSNITIQARISPELKKEAESIFSEIGLKTSDAIRMFLKQTVNSGGLPFRPHAKIPNDQTILAIKEAEERQGKIFNSVDELFDDLAD
jgi:DNA-damage-inducible protein J